MIEFTDRTIIEAEGNFHVVSDIMQKQGPPVWMIKTNAFIHSGPAAFNYVLHLWSNGNVKIMATDHPLNIVISDNDIRELKDWCDRNSWNTPIINELLLDTTTSFNFWLRLYRSGWIYSEILEKHDVDEMHRLTSDDDRDTEED